MLRTNIMEKNSQIDVLKRDVNTWNKLRSQLSSKSEHLMSEREELKEEVEALRTQVCSSVNSIYCLTKEATHFILLNI